MKVILSDQVSTSLGAMTEDEQRRVRAWFGYLKRWNEDEFVRSHSIPLDVNGESVYLFRTTSELRIFFTVDEELQTITVVDVTTAETILKFGGG